MNELITGDDWMLKVYGKSNGLGLWKGLFLALFCGVLFVLNASPAEATTVASGTCGENLTWTLDDEGTMIISGKGEMSLSYSSSAPWYSRRSLIKNVTIKNGVTSIGDSAFSDCSSLTSITIPNSVTSIGEAAFGGCSGLTSVTIPEGVTSIGILAFSGCSSLASITIPNSVTSIGEVAFGGCSGLTSVTIPESVTSIGNRTFSGCSSLTSVTIPEGVMIIGNEAFYNCKSLISITIPGSVRRIGDYAFVSCSSLTNITISKSVTSIGREVFLYCSKLKRINVFSDNTSYCVHNGILYDINRTELIRAESDLTSCIIPSTVTAIREGAFSECENLTNLTIPVSVNKIDGDNFSNCKQLKTVHYSGTSDQAEAIIISGNNGMLLTAEWICTDKHLFRTFGGTIGEGLEWNYTHDGHLTISGTGEIEDWIDYPWRPLSNVITSIDIAEGITYIGNYQFVSFTNLRTVTIPSSVTYIGILNFVLCPQLTYITVNPNNPKYASVDGVLFDKDAARLISCPAKKSSSYTIPEGTEQIGVFSFTWSGLKTIVIPQSVKIIEEDAFYNLGNIFYTGTEEQWKAIEIRDVENVESNDNNEWLLSVNITYGSEIIDQGSFGNGFSWMLDGEQRLIIHGTGEMPEYDNVPWELYQSEIRSIEIKNGITSVSDSAFRDCSSVMNVKIPSSVTSIGDHAFENCNSLTGIVLPDAVNNIGNEPFPQNVTVYCYEYSYAQFWAQDHGYTVVVLDNGELSDAITVTLPTSKIVMAGSACRMEETVFPVTEEITLVWTSSEKDVADVSKDGILTAYKAGTTTITLSAGGKTAQCVVTVVQGAKNFDIEQDIYVATTKTYQATPTNITPGDSTTDFQWTTGNTVYATVSSTGLVTGKAVGETTLTVTDTISGLTRTATIHICYPVQTVILTIDKTSIYAGLSTRATTLVTTTKGQSYENKLVTFSSSDPSVATVDQKGNIQTIKAGTVTITATAANGVTASKTLTVEAIQHILSLPVHLGEIESEAFAGLTAVEAVRIPEEVYYIADDAFAGSDVIILTPENSYAAQWAIDHGMTVIEESSR